MKLFGVTVTSNNSLFGVTVTLNSLFLLSGYLMASASYFPSLGGMFGVFPFGPLRLTRTSRLPLDAF